MNVLLLLILLAGLACGAVVPPIPLEDEDPGLRLNPTAEGAQVKLEAFIEMLCGDSQYSWPILHELSEYYGPEKLDVVVHQLPLPYHRQAVIVTQGLNLVRDQRDNASIAYITQVFDNSFRFGGALTRNMNQLEVTDMLAEIQEPVTGIDRADFAAGISSYEYTTIKQWKYGVRRNVAGTPWFYVNNVDLAVNPSIRLSFDDWREILDPLFVDSRDVAVVSASLLKVVDKINTSNLPKTTSGAIKSNEKANKAAATNQTDRKAKGGSASALKKLK